MLVTPVFTFTVLPLPTQSPFDGKDDYGNSLADQEPWADLECLASNMPDYF